MTYSWGNQIRMINESKHFLEGPKLQVRYSFKQDNFVYYPRRATGRGAELLQIIG